MPKSVSREVMVSLIDEVRGYLPAICEAIEVFRQDSEKTESLEQAYRLTHSAMGVCSMVGLPALSHIAGLQEQVLENLAQGQEALDDDTFSLLTETMACIEAYLNGLCSKELDESHLLAEVTRLYRRYRGLSQEEDEQEIAKVIEEVGNAPALATMIAQPTSKAPPGSQANSDPAQPISEVDLGLDGFDNVSPELIEVFTEEAEDHLKNMYSALTHLEKQSHDQELVQELRRAAHTLKGAAGAVGLRAVTKLSHRMEDLLDRLYEGGAEITPEILKLLFSTTDALQDLSGGQFDKVAIRTTIGDLYDEYASLLVEQQAGQTPADTDDQAAENELVLDVPDIPEEAAQTSEAPATTAETAGRGSGQALRVPIERIDELVRMVSELIINRTAYEQRMSDFGGFVEELQLTHERLRRLSNELETRYAVGALGGRHITPGNGTGLGKRGFQISSSRLEEFDALEFDQYTEFHLFSRSLSEATSDINTIGSELKTLIGEFDALLTRQRRLSRDAQDRLMKIRMVPLASIATHLHRTVRVVANQQQKLVDLVIEGEHIQLDKTVLEEMTDPLLHLIRNAVDHGIEPPEVRTAQGKPERAKIHIRASHRGTQVVIQITDDGSGLDAELLRSEAVRGGYVSGTDAASMSDKELFQLIFVPGFSTAREISEVSGRGVGMDIVRDKVRKLKGTVNVASTPSEGTAFTIQLPMTLAITRALLVRARSHTFALPMQAVTRILRLERKAVDRLGREPLIRVNGRAYPLVHLGDQLQLRQPADETADNMPMLLISSGDRQIALCVDRILAGREIVVKTLGSHLRRVWGLVGATLMGDGTVVPILDPAELVGQPIAKSFGMRTPSSLQTPSRGRPAQADETLTVMLVDDSVSVRRVMSNLIKGAGWVALDAKDGIDALEIIQKTSRKPDLFMLDIEMPRMDGYELLASLRSQEAHCQTPIVMVTSRAGKKHRCKAMDLGATDYLIKPYQDDVLLKLIAELVKKSQPKRDKELVGAT